MVRVITVDNEGYLYLVTRNEWEAREPNWRKPISRAFVRVLMTITHTPECSTRAQCVNQLKTLQYQHMAEGSSDIRPSFLIGGFGTVYEGRGWGEQTEYIANNPATLEIALIGNFATNSSTVGYPPYEMLASALTLVKYGLKSEFIRQDYRLTYTFPSLAAAKRPPAPPNHVTEPPVNQSPAYEI